MINGYDVFRHHNVPGVIPRCLVAFLLPPSQAIFSSGARVLRLGA